jgi:hypothetical protein
MIGSGVDAGGAPIDDFYRAVSTVSFTLLGLWWVVLQMKFREGAGEARRRRHAYGVALFFLLPGAMSLLSSVNSDHSALWRVAFGITALGGMLEVALYFASGGRRTLGPALLRVAGVVLYVAIALVALRPALTDDLGLELEPREVEAILVGLLVVVGAHLAWFGLTEPEETAGA